MLTTPPQRPGGLTHQQGDGAPRASTCRDTGGSGGSSLSDGGRAYSANAATPERTLHAGRASDVSKLARCLPVLSTVN